MYVVNPDIIKENKLYKTNGIIANWLINSKNIPLFGRGKNGEWYFANTDLLKEVLENIPFYYKITKNLF